MFLKPNCGKHTKTIYQFTEIYRNLIFHVSRKANIVNLNNLQLKNL